MTDWSGRPEANGWHWLRSKRNGGLRMAFFVRWGGWRISDAIGRTTIFSESRCARLYNYVAAVPEPVL